MIREPKEITNQKLYDMAREIVKYQKIAQDKKDEMLIDQEDNMLIDFWFGWLETELVEESDEQT